jgi:hypothetical protein
MEFTLLDRYAPSKNVPSTSHASLPAPLTLSSTPRSPREPTQGSQGTRMSTPRAPL